MRQAATVLVVLACVLIVHYLATHRDSIRSFAPHFSASKGKPPSPEDGRHGRTHSASASNTAKSNWNLIPTSAKYKLAQGKVAVTQARKPLANEVVLILKTGRATPAGRLRAQLETFASVKYGRSPDNTIITSDTNQTVEALGVSWQVTDVVGQLKANKKVAESDKYKIYTAQADRVKAGGNPQTSDPPGTNNEGWVLDALKFVPGYRMAAEMFPDAKWFIGLDDDNYLIWDSLLEFLSLLDHKEKYYIGSPSYMVANNVKFIHGGSVTISSQAAVRARFIEGAAGLDKFHEAAIDFCCGDGVLAMAYADIGILPDDRFRDFFNGEPIENTRVTPQKVCQPLMGLHHLSAEDILRLEDHLGKERNVEGDQLRAFTTWGDFLNLMTQAKNGKPATDLQGRPAWDFARIGDNGEKLAVSWQQEKSMEVCRATCDLHADQCLAWTYLKEKEECWISPWVVVGQKAEGSASGMNTKKVPELQASCSTNDWRQTVLRRIANAPFP